MSPTFNITTFGCQMNVRDSEWIAATLRARGFVETNMAEASVILINTCSVREKPEQKVKNTINKIDGLCRKKHIIGVLGCVAQQLGEELFEFSPNLRLIAGGDGIPDVPDAIEKLLQKAEARLVFRDFKDDYPERTITLEPSPAGSAFINIMQGCDNFCAYCIVPFTRGRQKSRASAEIIAECKRRLENGTRDITLLGQNVNSYGLDKNGAEIPFYELLARVSALPGLERLHFVTPHPKDLDDRTIAAFGDLPNLCPRLHLPLQSGSDNVLKKMKRRYNRDDFLRLVEKLRRARENIALSTDLIVGFPGESEDDFLATLKMMKECAFMSSYSFCYSDRPGTVASRMTGKIPESIKHERLYRLQELQEELGAAWLASRLGKRLTILVEGKSPKQNNGMVSWQGRDPWGAVVHVDLDGENHQGKMVNVEISAIKRHSLMGKCL